MWQPRPQFAFTPARYRRCNARPGALTAPSLLMADGFDTHIRLISPTMCLKHKLAFSSSYNQGLFKTQLRPSADKANTLTKAAN
jgi:hypothetical protein